MSEYRDLIQKEKEMALYEYQGDAFRLQLERNIAEASKPARSYARWFQRPAVAGSSVLLLIFLIWFSRQFILPRSPESSGIHLKNTLVQMFNKHEILLSQTPLIQDEESEPSDIQDFQWSLKRVFFTIQTENAQDDDIVHNLTTVLLKSAFFDIAEKVDSGERNI